MRRDTWSRLILAACLATAATGAGAAGQPILLLTRDDEEASALAKRVESDLAGRLALRTEYLSTQRLSDPIAKGRLLAALADAPLVVAVGAGPIGFAAGEIEDEPLYFIGSSMRGRSIAESRASLLLTYSAADVMKALPPRWRQSLGVLYTPGYEPVLDAIRDAARGAGVTLIMSEAKEHDVAGAARSILGRAKAVWVLGDPVISEGAGFEFLAEESLSQGVPLVGSSPEEVGRGALLCSQPSPSALARRASAVILELLADPSRRLIELAPPGGQILVHRRLADRFSLPTQREWMSR